MKHTLPNIPSTQYIQTSRHSWIYLVKVAGKTARRGDIGTHLLAEQINYANKLQICYEYTCCLYNNTTTIMNIVVSHH